MNDSNKIIGLRIAKAREGAKESQAELAAALGVKREMVTYWENGTRPIKAETIIAIADKYNVSADYLLDRDKSPTKAGDKKKAEIYTGLSSQAVENLREFNASGAHQLTKKWCDFLITSDAFIEISTILAEYSVASLRSIVERWKEEKKKKNGICSIRIGETPYETAMNSAGWKLSKCAVAMTAKIDASFRDGINDYITEIQHMFENADEFDDFCSYIKGGGK